MNLRFFLLCVLLCQACATQQSSKTTSNSLESKLETVKIERYELKDHPLAQSEQGRKMLKYLISCAMPANIELAITIEQQEYVFPGDMGLAPNWLSNAMSETEQRIVSACILARTNFFGVPVLISMRQPSDLIDDEHEKIEYTLFEGAFFGNLFSETPEAYVCVGDYSKEQSRDLIFNLRICTQASGKLSKDGKPLSYCDFVIVGKCHQQNIFTVNGKTYNEIFQVYLKPTNTYHLKK